jgi:nucleotide-binding universal stress UspA family protein
MLCLTPDRGKRWWLGRQVVPGVTYSAAVTDTAYRTVVVGTDGSESSLRAVARAGAIAGACGATLVVACAYLPTDADERELSRAQDLLGDEAYQVVGSHPAEETVRSAGERAAKAGATDIRTVAVMGSPVEALLDVVRRERADLLVVGNKGLNGIKGRLLGSVPADATRRSGVDVLVVHTT